MAKIDVERMKKVNREKQDLRITCCKCPCERNIDIINVKLLIQIDLSE